MKNATNKLLIFTISALLIIFYFWADKTELDLVTKGEGRLIAEGIPDGRTPALLLEYRQGIPQAHARHVSTFSTIPCGVAIL